jgi:hypothetical protein
MGQSEVLLGIHWELGEHIENLGKMLRTHWELGGNTLRTKKVPKTQTPLPLKVDMGLLSAGWPTSMGAHNFYAYLLFYHFRPRLKARASIIGHT